MALKNNFFSLVLMIKVYYSLGASHFNMTPQYRNA